MDKFLRILFEQQCSMERTMKKKEVISVDSYFIEEHTQVPDQLISNLYHFIASSYHLANQDELQDLIIQPKEQGKLIIFYGTNQEIAGFTRTIKQIIDLGKKQVFIYTAYIYLNPHYSVPPNTENTGLTEAIKDKLANPQEEIIYLAFANNPLIYKFISDLCDSIYPKPSQRVPDQIVAVINAFKKQTGWISTGNHPMVVNSPLVSLRSQNTLFVDEGCELIDFYLSTNPDYLQGNSLLVYIPVHLANIGYGLNAPNSNERYKPKSGQSHEIHHGKSSGLSA